MGIGNATAGGFSYAERDACVKVFCVNTCAVKSGLFSKILLFLLSNRK
jgi:hypothetical protein